MSAVPKVLAIVVNWNGRGVLASTLRSLQSCDYSNLSTLVVDNSSTDGSTEEAQPPAELLRLSQNKGYAAAINAGVSHAAGAGSGTDYFLILNNDIELDAAAIGKLVNFAEKQGPGVYGPQVRLRESPEQLEAAWGAIDWSHVLLRLEGKGSKVRTEFGEPRAVQVLLGCALLVHRRVFEQVGGFDERYFLYHEEVDFLYRVTKHGLPVWYVPEALVWHQSGHGTRANPLLKVYWIRRNTVLFLRKHRPGPLKWTKFWVSLAASLVYNLAAFQWGRASMILKGVSDGFRC